MTGLGNLSAWGTDREDTLATKHNSIASDRSSHFANSKHVRSMSAESTQLPPAVSVVPPELIRGYVHDKKIDDYRVGRTLGEGSFAKVKEALHVLVGEKVSYKCDSDRTARLIRSNYTRSTVQTCMCGEPSR